MTKSDIDNLFALLEIYFPNSQKTRNRQIKSAWALVLEPYDPKSVKSALVEHLRESKFFPDPQAIAVKCAMSTGVKAGKNESVATYDNYQPSPERIRANAEWLDKFLAEYDPGWEKRWEGRA